MISILPALSFISSSYWGIERDRPDKTDLENLPIPLDKLSSDELASWAKIHDEMAEETDRLLNKIEYFTDQNKITSAKLTVLFLA